MESASKNKAEFETLFMGSNLRVIASRVHVMTPANHYSLKEAICTAAVTVVVSLR